MEPTINKYTFKNVTNMNTNKEARWKGAGMGDYYCSLCCKTVSGNNERYCPRCGAEMYTDEEWEKHEKLFIKV